MKEQITPHLRKLIKHSTAIKKQFKKPRGKKEENGANFDELDPLGEESLFSPVKGLVHKFQNRVLWKVSYRCAAHCQICTRIRQIGSDRGDLSLEDIAAGAEYIKNHTEVDDVILSGGDPFVTPKNTSAILDELMKIDSVKVIRIGTRYPIHNPEGFKTKSIQELLKKIRHCSKNKAFYVLIHINHPDELRQCVLRSIKLIQKTGAIVFSQTVFSKNINDDVETLHKLFSILYYNKIIPYYIYRCDYVKRLERFICSLRKERKIITELRKRLSGIACPTYVIDVPDGRGKIPVPLDFWSGTTFRNCTDFDGKRIKLSVKKSSV